MRALIRADLEPREEFLQLWQDRENYNKQVVDIFRRMGYAPVKIGQKELLEDPFVKEIVQDIPPDIMEQETQHLIMLGYTGDGQSHFIVTGVNPTEIHIRVKGRLFGRLRRAVTDIIKNATQLRNQRTNRLFGKWKPLFNFNKTDIEFLPYIKIRQTIEVMEPMRDHPTILGEIIESASSEVLKQSRNEVALLYFTAIGAISLFFASPYLAPVMAQFLFTVGIVGYNANYIQGALERTYSAFLVSFAVTSLGLLTRIFDMARQKPIKWDSDVEVRRNH